MSSQLDPAILAAITEEARQCFLDEDAPEYLQALQEGLQLRDRADFTLILRAAHSLKGGAGLAALCGLQELSHKLEDVLQLVQQRALADVDSSWQLIERAVDEIAFVLAQARTVQDVTVDRGIITALEAVAAAHLNLETLDSNSPGNNASSANALIVKALTEDFEKNIAEIAELTDDIPEEILQPCLASFYDECSFLAETLNLPWLQESIESVQAIVADCPPLEALLLTQQIIPELLAQRDNYLAELETGETSQANANRDSGSTNLVTKALTEDLAGILAEIAELSDDFPEEILQPYLTDFYEQCLFLGETLNLPWLSEAVDPLAVFLDSPLAALAVAKEIAKELQIKCIEWLEDRIQPESVTQEQIDDIDTTEDFQATQLQLPTVIPQQPKTPEPLAVKGETALAQLRIPLQRLENMTNNVEELLLIQTRLQRQQRQIERSNQLLRRLARQFEPIRDSIQVVYHRLAIEDSKKNLIQQNNSADNSAFDALELDRYSELHLSLQSFQELILQISEARNDIDLANRELGEDVDRVTKNLDILYNNVTESRLVPFRVLAQRFMPQIQALNRRYEKEVNLKIQGETTLLDQVLLEQLQIPLTHLLNNAFDHGIESKLERQESQKPAASEIALICGVENNQLAITIKDDGRGINLRKVYQKAVDRGLCSPKISFEQLQPQDIIQFIFQPDFSTAAQVTDISGRGMGLDIVYDRVRKLRGRLNVDTEFGKGTTFRLQFPLNMSLLSVLLVQLQNRIVAIPNSSIRETFPYREVTYADSEEKTIVWQQKTIPLVSLAHLLPCPRQPFGVTQPKVVLVLETSFGLSAVFADGLLSEEKLIVKPFDDTIPVPPYLAGCTILGTGEVVPVMLPQGLESSITQFATVNTSTDTPKGDRNLTLLVAEDSVATRRMLERVLTAVGYQVVLCRDGQEAVEQLDRLQGKVDTIISDVEMPRMNGFELLQQVRSNSAWQQIPVIMATSRTGDRHREQAMSLGANNYIGKPIQPQELLDAIAALIMNS
jgi:chemotaxis protein histidine kinase CheA/ActR/RegA family two-component response regulator